MVKENRMKIMDDFFMGKKLSRVKENRMKIMDDFPLWEKKNLWLRKIE